MGVPRIHTVPEDWNGGAILMGEDDTIEGRLSTLTSRITEINNELSSRPKLYFDEGTPYLMDTLQDNTSSQIIDSGGFPVTARIRVSFVGETFGLATHSADGLMSATDKGKLDGIESGAQVNTVTGVKGDAEAAYRTGNINITPGNIGLGNVDNTADADKPVSAPQQAALQQRDAQIAQLREENALLQEIVRQMDPSIYQEASGNPVTIPDGYGGAALQSVTVDASLAGQTVTLTRYGVERTGNTPTAAQTVTVGTGGVLENVTLTTLQGENVIYASDGTSGIPLTVRYRADPGYMRYATYPAKTASGNPASFTDGAEDVPVKSLTVAFAPVQSGSGDPSPENVRPITGYTGVTICVSDYADPAILGVEVDMEAKTFIRIADAAGLSAGTDFDRFGLFGRRRRCNVLDDGTIAAWYGDEDFRTDGSNGQVMVFQPRFYYKVEPLKLEAYTFERDGETVTGYHLRKARYYVSDVWHESFKLHPAFLRDGQELDYLCLSAFEGSLYDVSAGAYITDDAQVADFNADKLCSIAGAKPLSGSSRNLTRANTRRLAQNRGPGWEQMYIKAAAASQLLMLVEYAAFDMQSAIGTGITSKAGGSGNEAEPTGATVNLGNASGQSASENNQNAVSYRGEENIWGNIWKWIDGLNVQNPETIESGAHGKLYVADHGFADDTGQTPYEDTGIYPVCKSGYANAFGYSEVCDYLFAASEVGGNSDLPVGDYFYNNNVGWRLSLSGGYWNIGASGGAFHLHLNSAVTSYARYTGGRLVYVPYVGGKYRGAKAQHRSFGQTVYGGTLSAQTGKLTVTHGVIQSYDPAVDAQKLTGAWLSDRDSADSGENILDPEVFLEADGWINDGNGYVGKVQAFYDAFHSGIPGLQFEQNTQYQLSLYYHSQATDCCTICFLHTDGTKSRRITTAYPNRQTLLSTPGKTVQALIADSISGSAALKNRIINPTLERVPPTTGAQVVYALETPIAYQLNPAEIPTLLGENRVFTDAGNAAVEYRADTMI